MITLVMFSINGEKYKLRSNTREAWETSEQRGHIRTPSKTIPLVGYEARCYCTY